jgi:nitrite reductase (NADH) large subunit
MKQARRPSLVVIGTGLAGARVIEESLARAPDRFTIRAFGEEPHGTYNRILLSNVLAGTAEPNRLWLNALDWYRDHGVLVHAGIRAESIDTKARTVTGAGGKVVEPYDHLILATGSRAIVPDVSGNRLDGVYVFRTLDDCSAIGNAAREAERAVVIGGGLLGLEAARGLLAHGVEVTVVESAPHLMPRQLDVAGGLMLARQMESLGVDVRTGTSLARIEGEDGAVEAAVLSDGTRIEASLVVFACGITPNLGPAREAGLSVNRGILVDAQMRTSAEGVWAVGECAEFAGECVGLVEPVYEQARVLADVLTGANPKAAFAGARPVATLKVMGVSLTSLGDVHAKGQGVEVASHLDTNTGVYKKLVVRDGSLVGAVLLGADDPGGVLRRMFLGGDPVNGSPVDLLTTTARDALLSHGGEVAALPDATQVCNCHAVTKGTICSAIKAGCRSVQAVGEATRAGTGCGSCQPLLSLLVQASGGPAAKPAGPNKIEAMKTARDGLDAKPDILRLARENNWQEMSEDDKQRAKWYGLFFRKQTPGHFMLRLRHNAGRVTADQLHTIADLSDEYGRGFCDLTTRQQIQMRWFTLGDVPDIWRRLEAVGLGGMQTGLDNVRGLCGCPLSGRTPHELLDASGVIEELNSMIVGNREFTNLPRKFNVTITGCLENCCHVETQDVGLVPAFRELEGRQVNGFNVLVGGKQGSGGYTPAEPLDVFVRPDEAALVCRELILIFRDHGNRSQRTRARMRHLIDEKGLPWLRAEAASRMGTKLLQAGKDVRKPTHADHVGIHPQKAVRGGEPLFSAGLLVPVGRITTAQMRGVADLARRYGSGELRLTVQQNVIILDVPASRIGALSEEPLLKDLTPDPSPIMRGLVSCTGNDYCHMALIETKGWALEVARELEKRTYGLKLAPLTMHWSGCPASCGLHQVATIGLQGCRSRVNGTIVDAAHVTVKGAAGPHAKVAEDLMYDVPCDQLADALLPLVKHLPRK